ncbi:MAG: hypothetical protein II409_04050 [Clostridia bacterium]|nr:hypothetical protein [Clostridia bacterium]
MTETKVKAPFISGPYYKEIFREMKTIGIIFCVLQTVVGLLENFGSPILALFIMFTGTGRYQNVMLVYFFVAALNFLNAYIKRSAWDLRGSLPLKKRTVFASHLAAALTWAALIFIANYVGMLLGELLRLIPGVNAASVPAGYIGAGAALLQQAMLGLIVYGVITMLGSVVNKAFSLLIAGAVIVLVPVLYFGFAQGMSTSTFSIIEHLLPIGLKARTAVLTVLAALAAIAAIVLAYIAFSKSQAETHNKPARTKAIHIAIGVGLAALVGLFVMRSVGAISSVSVQSIAQGSSDSTGTVLLGAIIALVLMLISYMVYMWVSLKSFKKACKNLVFLPIAIVLIASALLFTGFADRQFEKLDASVNNVDHVVIPSGEYSDGIVDLASNMLFGGSSVRRGSDGSERVKLTDAGLLREAAGLLSTRLAGSEYSEYDTGLVMIDDLFYGAFYGNNQNVDIALKNGGTWTVNISDYEFREKLAPYVNDNADYVSRYTDMKRFRGGSVVGTDGLDRQFAKTLIAELEGLSPADRLEVFTDSTVDSYWDIGMDLGTVSDSLATLTLASPTYDHVTPVRLTEKLPKTRLMYMQQLSENARKARGFDEFTEKLKAADYRDFYGNLILIGGGSVNEYNFSYWPNDRDYEGSYLSYQKRISAMLADIITENRPIESAEYVVGVAIDDFRIDGLKDSSYGRSLIHDKTVFMGVSRETYEELMELFAYEMDGGDPIDGGSEWM